MTTTSEIWIAFARTFSMLFLVLALLILVFYLMRKFSGFRGLAQGKGYIRTLSVHHFSSKEKLVLVEVMGDVLLLGVTPQGITRISSVDPSAVVPENKINPAAFHFSDYLKQKLGRKEGIKEKGAAHEKAD